MKTTICYLAHNLNDTRRLGRLLAQAASPGITIGLIGPLGAGKTELVAAVAQGLGIDRAAVASPTFVLIHEYPGRIPIYHFDTYRLRTPEEFAALGVEEYFSGDGISFVEWADRVGDCLPADRLEIRITITGPAERQFDLSAHGPASAQLLERFQTLLSNTEPQHAFNTP